MLIGCTSVESSETEDASIFVEDETIVYSEPDVLSEPEIIYEEEEDEEPVVAFISSAVGGNFPVFSAQYDEMWQEVLFPQWVEVLSEDGYWLEVLIEGESWWIDMDFVPPVDELTEAFLLMGDDTSFYFHNLETGFSYGFNSDKVYRGASVGKVFFAHFLYLQDELGVIALTEQERLWIQYTLRTSLDEFSDNLHARYGLIAYNDWLNDQGVYNLQNPHHHYGSTAQFSAEEAALLMYGIYQYFRTATPNAIEFRENMVSNEVPFIVSNNYEVASKTGWVYVWEVIHDVAIVKSPSPYILVILSQNPRIGGTRNHRHYFEQFSQLFEEFNDRWFVTE